MRFECEYLDTGFPGLTPCNLAKDSYISDSLSIKN